MYDPQQHIYGLPDYIGGVHSALLNSEAVIFRRRYHNGAHTGGILYTRDPSMTDEMEEEIEQQLRDSKGIGNFSTILVNIPGGDKDGIKFIEMGDISAKDEFASVKNISAQDILNAHRFPAGLAGIVPQNTAGLGDPEKVERTYKKNEVLPIQRRLAMAISDDPEIPRHLHLNFQRKQRRRVQHETKKAKIQAFFDSWRWNMRVLKIECPECGSKAMIRKTNRNTARLQIFIAPVLMWSVGTLLL
jgi:hypothetical protein